jgi:hypothetical protein
MKKEKNLANNNFHSTAGRLQKKALDSYIENASEKC